MKVQLKVLSGSHAGKCVSLAGAQFVIGRGEECNLRSNSDAVSRRHCVIAVSSSKVSVRDLGSRNGTYVNGKRIDGDFVLNASDQLTVGPLQFQVLLSQSPSVSDKQQTTAADQRPAGGASGQWDDDSVSQWLDEADAAERAQRLTDPDTRVFKLDETVGGQEVKEKDPKKKSPRAKKKPPAKLPPKKDNSKDSQEAAAQMLRRLFNRG